MFTGYVFKGFSGQDNEQVASANGHIVREVKKRRPEVRDIVFQSDNASWSTLQELIPLIYHLNAQSIKDRSPVILTWIFAEAQAWRGRLHAHFSYINLILKVLLEDGQDIIFKEDTVHVLSFYEEIAETTAALPDFAHLLQTAILKKFKWTQIGSRATQKFLWYQHKV